MLCEMIGTRSIKELFVSPAEYHLFPKYAERAAWEALSAETRQRWIADAENDMNYNWPITPMYVYRVYGTEGNFAPHWLSYTEKRAALGIFTLAECMEGKGRFIQQIINGIYAVCECTTWTPPVDLNNSNQGIPDENYRIVDLGSSETAVLLAWVYYLMKDTLDDISPRICRRLFKEVRDRVVRPYTAIDTYWWMGYIENRINNWNPWCNANVLMCHLTMDFGEAEREKALKRMAYSLDVYHRTYSEDGGCDEGPMYWGAAGGGYNVCLELFRDATRGAVDGFDNEKVKRMGTYLYKVFIDGDYFVDYADGDAIVPLPPIVLKYGQNIHDPLLTQLGASSTGMKINRQNWFNPYHYMTDVFTEAERKALRSAAPPYIRDAWLDTVQVMTARENEGSAEGLYLSAKGGHNEESHNHNDVGNFIVYLDGQPLFIDFGTEEYKAQTFSPQRFELWYLQSQYHNCPTVNGTLQKDGKAFYAKDVRYFCGDVSACLAPDIAPGDASALTMDIAPAYPAEAGVTRWHRQLVLDRKAKAVLVWDDFLLAQASPVSYNFVTQKEPVVTAQGIEVALDGVTGLLLYDTAALDAKIEKIELTDIRLHRNWGDTAYRVVLSEKENVQAAVRGFKIVKK